MHVAAGTKMLRIKDCRGASSVRGLMFDPLIERDGALIYANNIWMPFVKHELDLFFLDERFRVVKRERAVPVTLNPKTWKTYRCAEARYCLEVKAGLVKERAPRLQWVRADSNRRPSPRQGDVIYGRITATEISKTSDLCR